jgi:universal stress protein A
MRKSKRSDSKSAPAAREIARILVPVDFSEPSVNAVRFARRIAEKHGAAIKLAHVVEPFHTDWKMNTTEIQHEARSEATGRLQALVGNELSGIPSETELLEGHPVEKLCEFARKWRADLLVISTQGRSQVRDVLMGSVAERVVRHAPCPVLVVRMGAK